MIKLTHKSGRTVYLNKEMIGDLMMVEKDNQQFTRIGHLTHNNGGFYVIETVEEVLNKIK